MAFDGFQHQTQYLSVDHELVDKIVNKLKSQGIFDQFRKDCLADVDTKPAYQQLQQRVNGSVSVFLKSKKWKQDLNKTQLRESLRHHVQQGFLQAGVDRIVDQVVNSKIYSVFMPKVEDMVYETLGIEKPKKVERVKGTSLAPKTEEVPKEEPKPPEEVKEEDVSPPGESPKPPVESPKIPEEPPKAPTPIPGVSTEAIPSEDEVDKDDSNTIDETPFLLASLKNKENENSNSKISSEISSHTIHEISSTTEGFAPKTPLKTNTTPKLDNFSNLSEKLKQFDPLAQPVKNDDKTDIKNFPEEDTSSSMQIDESNGFNDSNIEFERLLSEDSKSSMSDFKKYKASKTDKIKDEDSLNDSNLENKIKKPDTKKTEKRESSSKDRSRRDSDRKDSKSSHSRSSRHKDSSRDKDKKDDKKSSKDERHRKSSTSSSHKHKSDRHDDKKKKEDDKKESRKRKNERCSDSKSKESRRSTDRDNSGSGHSSKKPSRSEHRSSSKSSSSKTKEPEQKNSQEVQDSVDGLNEVDLILMKINSSIEEEMALEPKKTKFAKNIHEAKKINAKRNLEKQKTEPDDIVNNKENLTGNNVPTQNNSDTQKSEKEFTPVNFLTAFNKYESDKIKDGSNLCGKNQDISENQVAPTENSQESDQIKGPDEDTIKYSDDDEDFLGFDNETIQKSMVQLQSLKYIWGRILSSDDKMNNNLDKSRKRSNIEPIPVESKKPKETDVAMDTSMDDTVENDESSSLTEAMLNNLLQETSTVQIQHGDSDSSAEIVQSLKNSPVKQPPKEDDKPDKKTTARTEKRRRSSRALPRYSGQRYDSADLYKPKVLSQSSRRSRALNDSINTLKKEVLDERKRLR